MMKFQRPIAGIVVAAAAVLALAPGQAADAFPFEKELLLQAAPMKPGKRMPALTVAENGDAVIDLWCKTVRARVEFTDDAVKIEPGPLPDALPDMQGNGQCTQERMDADTVLLSDLAQITQWRLQGGAVVLMGPTMLKFRSATN